MPGVSSRHPLVRQQSDQARQVLSRWVPSLEGVNRFKISNHCCIYTITCPDKSLEAAEEFQTPRHPWMPSTPPTEAHLTSQVVRILTSFFLTSGFFSLDVEYGATSGTATPTGSESAANQVEDSFLQTRKKSFVWTGCE